MDRLGLAGLSIAEMASPQRMGAAFTYARGYGLFTLVGIAGEECAGLVRGVNFAVVVNRVRARLAAR